MIEYLEVKNFKSIKGKKFQFRNLNILLGLNGQGKSSLIQGLLLLRQSNDLRNNLGWLKLRGDYVNIGNSKDAFYQYAKKDNLQLILKFRDKLPIPFCYEYKLEEDYLRNIKIKEIDLENELKSSTEISGLFSDNFQYLSAFRIKPKSTYPKSNNDVVGNRNIGNDGKYSIHFIETYHDEEVAFENLFHPNSYLVDELLEKTIINKTLINQVNLWLGEISPGINVRTTSINQDEVLLEYDYNQPNYGTTNKFKPENVGFGITYALPVIVSLLSAKPGALIIIENPESHIHPKGQAELGKLIALVAQNNVQIIIETHSDHIINGIRVGIKEEKLNKEKATIFYFKKVVKEAEQYSKIIDIGIDSNGTLSEEPDGLLDEWGIQLLKLF